MCHKLGESSSWAAIENGRKRVWRTLLVSLALVLWCTFYRNNICFGKERKSKERMLAKIKREMATHLSNI